MQRGFRSLFLLLPLLLGAVGCDGSLQGIDPPAAAMLRAGCPERGEVEERERSFEIAERFAPVVLQETGWRRRADYITRFDFDGNVTGRDNWQHLGAYPLPAYVYFSVIETETHVFLGYFFFHAARYGTFFDNDFESYENDMNGLLLVLDREAVDRGAGPSESVLFMETRSREQFLQYTNDARVRQGTEEIDGPIFFDEADRLWVGVAARHHGVHAASAEEIEGAGARSIVYFYDGVAGVPTRRSRRVGYALLPLLTELWPLRANIGEGRTFDRPFLFGQHCLVGGNFDGDDYLEDWARPPWSWDEVDDGAVGRGEWFFLPAETVVSHLMLPEPFSLRYTYHPYLSLSEE
ncbi:MAG: hypothetical protein D6795_14760 [Deltaproteobacteria bacterium]|nr:MAG: hypothetical protein D6795_14760 [Deltaproteobacteria bacterium]